MNPAHRPEITDRDHSYLARINALGPEIARLASDSDERRGISPELLDLLVRAQLFGMFVPQRIGGLELDLVTGLRAIEEVAAADTTAAWLLVKGSWSNMLAGRLPPEIADRIWDSPDSVMAGTLNPKGRAVAVADGYRLTGRWDWGTGTQFASWIMAAALVVDDSGAPIQTEAGPKRLTFLAPAGAFEIVDTWRTYGMKGTASNDFACEDLFVPEAFAIDIENTGTPHPLYDRLPYMAQVMLPHGPLAIGGATGCIDALCDLAQGKTPAFSRTLLKSREWVQDAVGRATAIVNSARAYFYQAVEAAVAAPGYHPRHGLQLSLATTHATHACVEAADLMTRAAGGTAVYLASPIQKYFRDLHVAASHAAVDVERYAGAGRVIFGDSAHPLM